MHLAGKHQKKFVDEINITPLTDVFLVLLIVMMLVAPMLAKIRQDIHPPDVEGASPLTEVKLLVEITREGACFLDGEPIEAGNLVAALRAKGEQPEIKKAVVLRADKESKTKSMITVMNAAKEAAFQKMTIAIETLSPERKKELDEKAAGGGDLTR